MSSHRDPAREERASYVRRGRRGRVQRRQAAPTKTRKRQSKTANARSSARSGRRTGQGVGQTSGKRPTRAAARKSGGRLAALRAGLGRRSGVWLLAAVIAATLFGLSQTEAGARLLNLRLDSPVTNAEGSAASANRPKVEVLNGTGAAGLASDAADELRGMRFDVVQVGNADHFDYETTHVLDRSGSGRVARLLADSLGIDSVAMAPDPELFLDATVILGRDFVDKLARQRQ